MTRPGPARPWLLPLLVLLALALAGCSAPPTAQEPSDGATSVGPEAPAPDGAPGDAIVLLSPEDGARRVDPRRVVLAWDAPALPGTEVLVVLGDDRAPCVEDAPEAADDAQVCVLAGLAPGADHAWAVGLFRGEDLVLRSPVGTFRTDAPPSAPVPTFPAEGSHDMTPAKAFRYEGATDPDGDRVTHLLEVRDVAGNESTRVVCRPAPLPCRARVHEARAYEWRVVASDGILENASPYVAFRTDARPTPPVLAGPAEGAIQQPLDLALSWSPSVDADGDALTYRVTLHADLTGETVACETQDVTCALPRLRAGQAYTLRVAARDPAGLEGHATLRFTTRLPVLFLHGWTGDWTTWEHLAGRLAADGYEVLDFTNVTGHRLLHYLPRDDAEGIERLAAAQVAPLVRQALEGHGYPPDQRLDVVAHSMGGLIARTLVEKEGATGPGFAIPHGWSRQVRTLSLVGTPNQGSKWAGEWNCYKDGTDTNVWYASCLQLQAEGDFVHRFLGTAPPPTTVRAVRYYTYGGGSDWVVGPDSPRLPDVPHFHFDQGCHAYHADWYSPDCTDHALPRSDDVYRALLEVLR